jgi:hypothetical protein
MGISTRIPGPTGRRLKGWCRLAQGLLLFASWLGGPIPPLWDQLDQWFFTFSNSSLGLNPLWDGLWAVSNNRLFDLVVALGMTAVFIWSGLSSRPGGWSQLAQGLIHEFLDLPRASPTLQVEGSQRLSQLVT